MRAQQFSNFIAIVLPFGAFAFAVVMAGIETLVASVSPHGSAGSFAYSQVEFLPVVQAASLGGASAITFTVCLFASAMAVMVARRDWIPAAGPVATVAALLAWGALRI